MKRHDVATVRFGHDATGPRTLLERIEAILAPSSGQVRLMAAHETGNTSAAEQRRPCYRTHFMALLPCSVGKVDTLSR